MLFLAAVGLSARAACTAGYPNSYAIESEPNTDFNDNGNGTVTHFKTGLMWKNCAEGQTWANSYYDWWTGTIIPATCTNSGLAQNWSNAVQTAKNAGIQAHLGYTDWRLPNKKELESIVEDCGRVPALNQLRFPHANYDAPFWSSTLYTPNSTNAWGVNFMDGGTSPAPRTYNLYVHLVRGGPLLDSFDALNPTAHVGVIYNGNGNSGGSVPTDNHVYTEGTAITAAGNTGHLVKAGNYFLGWNTAADGSGAAYSVGSTFMMGLYQNTLYAQWALLPSDIVVLKDIAISDGSLSPGFNGNTLAYTTLAPYATKAVWVKPTVSYGDVTITVNGIPVASGIASGWIDLGVGKNLINVVVTAQDGSTSQTYKITVTRLASAPDLTLTLSHSGNFVRGQAHAVYTITVSNVGDIATDGSKVGMSVILPAGLRATALSGSGWICVLSTVTRSCTRTDVLASGASYPAITLAVGVANNAAASLVNSARVSGGGDLNTANNLVNDPTRVVANLTSVLLLLLD